MEENENNQQPKQNKPIDGMAVVGINLAVLAVYTLLIKAAGDGGGFILDAFLLLLHVFDLHPHVD